MNIDNNSNMRKDANYYRYIFQKCSELGKLVIITGIYEGSCKSDIKNRVTFSSIYPYISEKDYILTELTDHINLNREDCNEAIKVSNTTLEMGNKYILVGKSYVYMNKKNEIKGGILLTNELKNYGLYAINDFSTKYYNIIPNNLIIDFRKEFMGLFAWNKKNDIDNERMINENKKTDINQSFTTSFTFIEKIKINENEKTINVSSDNVLKSKNMIKQDSNNNTLDSRLDIYSKDLSNDILKNSILDMTNTIFHIPNPNNVINMKKVKRRKRREYQ